MKKTSRIWVCVVSLLVAGMLTPAFAEGIIYTQEFDGAEFTLPTDWERTGGADHKGYCTGDGRLIMDYVKAGASVPDLVNYYKAGVTDKPQWTDMTAEAELDWGDCYYPGTNSLGIMLRSSAGTDISNTTYYVSYVYLKRTATGWDAPKASLRIGRHDGSGGIVIADEMLINSGNLGGQSGTFYMRFSAMNSPTGVNLSASLFSDADFTALVVNAGVATGTVTCCDTDANRITGPGGVGIASTVFRSNDTTLEEMYADSLSISNNPPLVAADYDLPFVETYDGSGMATNIGPMHGQHGWEGDPTNGVLVQTAVVRRGVKAGSVDNAVMSHSFSNAAATNVWIDFFSKPAFSSSAPTPNTNAVAAFYVNDDGKVVVRDDSTWTTKTNIVSSNDWTRFTVNLDYVTRKWALYVCDNTTNKLSDMVATNLAFQSTASNQTYFSKYRVINQAE